MSATLEAYEVVEKLEEAIASLTPVENDGEFDRFVILESPTVDVITRAVDRSIVCNEVQPPTRKASSGGCQIATMLIDVSGIYGVTKASRRRRLTDGWQLEGCFHAFRLAQPAVRSVTVTPAPNEPFPDLTGVAVGWRLAIEFMTTPAAA